MLFREVSVDDVVVFALFGKMCTYADTALIRAKIRAYLEGGKKGFVLDMADVSWITTEGINFLASNMAAVAIAGGHLVLFNTNVKVERALASTKCDSFIRHFGNRQEAVDFVSNKAVSI